MKLPLSLADHRRLGCFVSVTLALSVSTSAYGQLVYENRFDDISNVELNGGAGFGPGGSGVSGKPNDKSYYADATKAEGDPSAMARLLDGPEGMASDEVTMTVWYKPSAEILDAATIFRAFAGQLMWEGRRGEWVLRLDAWPEDPTKKNLHWFYSGKPIELALPDRWIFLAFVWKKQDNSSQFWIGTDVDPVVSGRQGSRPDPLSPIGERNPQRRSLGNEPRDNPGRPFNGNIDNFRVYATALDEATIEKIREADVANEPVALP